MGQAKIVRNEPDLSVLKRAKKDKLNEVCKQAIVTGMQSSVVLTSTGSAHFYSTDADDQRNFMGKHAILMQDPTIDTVMWKTEDTGNFEVHTREEFFAICREIMLFIEQNIGTAVIKKAMVDGAATLEEIENIN